MKCPRCHGTGKITEWVATDTLSEYEFPCRKCNGTGEITLTNEEWFCQLPTEEKAKTIICLAVNSMHKKRKGLIDSDVGEIMRWLKEVHKE